MYLLKLDDISKLNALKLFHNFKNNKLPYFIKDMFASDPTHNYETRFSTNPNICAIKTSGAKQRIKYFLPKLLQNISPTIREKLDTHSLRWVATGE